MDIWSILEIEPTDQEREIKKAYAKKLKLHNPEEDPVGYQVLREAYDKALKIAKNKETFIYDKPVEIKNDFTNKEAFINVDMHYQNIDNTNSKDDNDIEEMNSITEKFMEGVYSLYMDFHKRIDVDSWKKLLDSDILWNLNYKNNISKSIVNFLEDYSNIPIEIWLELNKTFQWSNDEDYLRYVTQVGNISGLRYQYISEKTGLDYDTFLDYRRFAFIALKNDDLNEAENYLSRANELFQADPDLICLEGELYVKRKQLLKAKAIFKEAININKKDNKTALFIANIYYKNGNPEEAYSLCKSLLKEEPNNIEIRLLLGKFYLEADNLKKAQSVFLECLNYKTHLEEIRMYLNIIIKAYERIYKQEPLNLFMMKNIKTLYKALGETEKAQQLKFNIRTLPIRSKTIVYTIILLIGLSLVHSVFFKFKEKINPEIKNVTTKKVEIGWNEVSKADAYNVYRRDVASGFYGRVAITKDTKFIDNNLEPNKEYKYIVVSIKNGEDDISSEPISIKTDYEK